MVFSPMNAVLQRLRKIVAPTPGEVTSDARLLSAYVGGQPEAFEELMRRHGGMVWGVCRRVLGNAADADDAFQAVFMVLARKAGSLARREQLAGWLYGVALRTANKARVAAARRRRREETVATMTHEAVAPAPDDLVRPVLDEELSRLPEKFRMPVLLCYLEGNSNDEAARRLGCSVGAVKMRLSRGRDLLRDRLGRRGVAVSAIALATLLEGEAALAAVREPLVNTSLKAATSFAAGSATSATSAAALAEGVIRDMFFTKVKFVAVVVVGLGLLGVSIGLSARAKETTPVTRSGDEQVAAAVDVKPAPAAPPAPAVDPGDPTPGDIKLLPGYRHRKLQGKDTRVGKIWKEGGLTFNYDIGSLAGKLDKRDLKDSFLWYKEQDLAGRSVRLALMKDKMLYVTFPEKSANFFGKPTSEEQIVDMLLMALTFTPTPAAGAEEPAALPENLKLLPGYQHGKLQGIDSRCGKFSKEGGFVFNYDAGGKGWGDGAKSLEKEKALTLWYKEQDVVGRPVHLALTKDRMLYVSFPKTRATFYGKTKSEEEIVDMLLMVLTSPAKAK
jgi:RNA polymerase sigma factor (sigma-70 family)